MATATRIILPNTNASRVPGKGLISVQSGFRSLMETGNYLQGTRKQVVPYDVLHSGIMGGRIRSANAEPICSSELIAFPGIHGRFSRGMDIIDDQTGTRISWSSLRDYNICGNKKEGKKPAVKPAAMLIIVPGRFEKFMGGSEIAVIAKSVIVLEQRGNLLVPRGLPDDKCGVAEGMPSEDGNFVMQVKYLGAKGRPRTKGHLFTLLPHKSVRTLSCTLDSATHGTDARLHILATLPLNHNYSVAFEAIRE